MTFYSFVLGFIVGCMTLPAISFGLDFIDHIETTRHKKKVLTKQIEILEKHSMTHNHRRIPNMHFATCTRIG